MVAQADVLNIGEHAGGVDGRQGSGARDVATDDQAHPGPLLGECWRVLQDRRCGGLGGGEVLGGDLRGAGSEGRAVLLEGSVRGAAPLVDRLGGNAVA